MILVVLLGCGSNEPLISKGKLPSDWVEDLRHDDPAVRVTAVKKLGNIGQRDPDALPGIYEALSDASATVRKEAIYAVVRTFPASREALPILEQMIVDDPDESIRKIASEAHQNLTNPR